MADPAALPDEAGDVLSVRPDQFVSERARLVKRLRDAGRSEDAAVVAKLRKPRKVVLEVNRAARELPRQVRAAARASERVVVAQARGRRDQLERSQAQLHEAVEALVAVAAGSSTDRTPAHRLIRAALGSDVGRRALERGVLTDVLEASGFDALAGMEISPPAQERGRAQPTAFERRETADKERRRELEKELAAARASVRDAKRAEQRARSELEAAERRLASIETALERLTAGKKR